MRNRSLGQSSLRRPIVRAAFAAAALWVGGAACGSTTIELLPSNQSPAAGGTVAEQGGSATSGAEPPEGGAGNVGSESAGGSVAPGGRPGTGGQSGDQGSIGGTFSGGGGTSGGAPLSSGGAGGTCAPFCGGGTAPVSCSGNGDCRPGNMQSQQSFCNLGMGVCVTCLQKSDCFDKEDECDSSGRCRRPCGNDVDCLPTARLCRDDWCVECAKNSDCTTGAGGRSPVLDTCVNNRCVECTSDAQCTSPEAPHCWLATRCRACSEDSHCTTPNQHCVRGDCVDDR